MTSFFSIVPSPVLGAAIMLLPALAALAIYRLLTRSLIRLAGRRSLFLQRLLQRGQSPASVFIVIVAMGAMLPVANFSLPVVLDIGHALLVALILTAGWAAGIALDIAITIYLRRFRTDAEDNLLARKHVTQMRILQRVATSLLAILTIGAALMTFDAVRQYGVSLFASAGAAGIVIGLAARPLFTNLFAGIQIAMTQPIRVEDQVVVEGENGWIERITSTYIVIRIWDLRRMIVPLSYFIDKPFQNWTYEDPSQLGAVILHVDYSVPVDRVRQKLEEIVRASPLWDGKVANLQVTDASGSAIELRALVSARNPSQTWDLRCEVREKLIGFLQAEYPSALPRQRFEALAERKPADLAALPASDPPAATGQTVERRSASPARH
jgi:small-conductance mechanosensitive channel